MVSGPILPLLLLQGPSGWLAGSTSPSLSLTLDPAKRPVHLTRFDPTPLAGRQHIEAVQQSSSQPNEGVAPSASTLAVVKMRPAKEKTEIKVERREGESFMMPQVR